MEAILLKIAVPSFIFIVECPENSGTFSRKCPYHMSQFRNSHLNEFSHCLVFLTAGHGPSAILNLPVVF